MNWEDLAAKKVPAPFKPVIRDELDVSNFAEEFTEMDPTYSPAALPQNCDRIFQVGLLGSLDHQTCCCCCDSLLFTYTLPFKSLGSLRNVLIFQSTVFFNEDNIK